MMVAGLAVLIHDESTEIPLVTSSPGELQVTPSRTIITPRPRVYRNYNYSCWQSKRSHGKLTVLEGSIIYK